MERIGARLFNWASILADDTRKQAETTAGMPFVHTHVALMPDAHLGLGATVGSVIPTLRAIMPAAVGVDIGCGMIAVRTQFVAADLAGRALSELRVAVEQTIPTAAGGRNTTLTDTVRPRIAALEAQADGFDPGERSAGWREQLGSLGSGNHFIEVSLDEADRVWLFLHSGSRGVGNQIAQHHIAVARSLMERWWVPLPDRDLAYLVEGTDEFDAYRTELDWAQTYALLNREEMMDRLVGCVSAFLGAAVVEAERVNCHHNFTQSERHFGKTVWVSRKGCSAVRGDDPPRPPRGFPSLALRKPGNGRRAPRPAGVLPLPGAADVHPRSAPGSDGRHRVPRHRGLPGRDPGRVQGRRPGDGGCGGPGHRPPHPAADRQREGELALRDPRRRSRTPPDEPHTVDGVRLNRRCAAVSSGGTDG